MRVYKIKISGLNGPYVLDNIKDTIIEIRTHLIEGPIKKGITIVVDEIDEVDYNNIPEFRGF